MNTHIIFAVLCVSIIGQIQADDASNKCRVDVSEDTNNVAVYCYYLEINDKDLPLDATVPNSEYLSLHLINCNGSITENSFPNLKNVNSISITGSLDKFVLPHLPKLSYIQIDNVHLPTLKGAFKNVQDSLTGIKIDDTPVDIDDDVFTGLSNVENLELIKQNVTSLKWLKDLNKLEKLLINEADIETIAKNSFEHNPELSTIDFISVPIKTIENGAFDKLKDLEMLILTSTDLQNFDWKLIEHSPNLHGLGIPARSVKNVDVQKILKNSPKLSAFYFLERDMSCPEIKYLLDEIEKSHALVGVAYSGRTEKYDKTC